METIRKIIRVDRREISFLKFILEAYDGIATITTIDARQGVVLLRIAPGCEKEVEALLRDLGKDILIDVFDSPRDTMIDECN
ncbi:MAG: DUF4911 domain-containing protein [Desulfobacterales bacterium]